MTPALNTSHATAINLWFRNLAWLFAISTISDRACQTSLYIDGANCTVSHIGNIDNHSLLFLNKSLDNDICYSANYKLKSAHRTVAKLS